MFQLETVVNELLKKTTEEAEFSDTKGTQGETGDTKIIQNTDKTYSFNIMTADGWKTPVWKGSEITFKDKPKKEKQIKKTIEQIESEDSSTGGNTAQNTIYDESSKTFRVNHLTGVPRPDFDSGWIRYIWTDNNIDADPALSIPHTLGVLPSIIVAYIAPDQGSGSNGDAVASSEITYFTQMSGHHMGSSSHGQARYGVVFKVTSSAVLFTSGDASAGYWSNFNTGSAAGAKENNGSHSIRYLLWK